jgi:hypothetical protein
VPLDPNQRNRLLAAKARALVGDATGIEQSELRTTPFTGGAMVYVDQAVWCLLDDGAIRSFGPAMVLADRENFETFHVMAESEATSGVIARRAAQFTNGPRNINASPARLIGGRFAPQLPFGHHLIHGRTLVNGWVHRQGDDFHVHTFFV